MMRFLPALTLCAALAGACGYEFEPPDQAVRMEEARARYSPALFDTVQWSSDSDRALRGNDVYAAKCRRCHGPLGRGATDYAQERGLEVPSLVSADWRFAAQFDSVRREVFMGHDGGMPIFGVAGLTPRDIDSSSYYILEVLRPDVLGTGG